jgi:secreted trypsin-like serine protease
MLVALSALAFACDGTPETSQDTRAIIGGARSAADEHAAVGAVLGVIADGWQLAGEFYICSGALIAPDVVLTASHCLTDEVRFAGTIGEHRFTLATDVNEIIDVDLMTIGSVGRLQHPKVGWRFEDIGLLFLERPIEDVEPFAFAQPDDGAMFDRGTNVTIVGYGRIDGDTWSAGVRHHAETFISAVTDREIMIGTSTSARKCFGDSGGPTLLDIRGRPTIIGITSHASFSDDGTCNRQGFDVRVDYYSKWIQKELDEACTEGLRVTCPKAAPVEMETGGCTSTRGGGDAIALLLVVFCAIRAYARGRGGS